MVFMCDIAGWLSYWGVDTARVEPMVRALSRRGPDTHGVWQDPAGHIALGHARLSMSDCGRHRTVPLHVTYSNRLFEGCLTRMNDPGMVRILWTLLVLMTWKEEYEVNLPVLYPQCESTGSREVSREGDL